MAAFFLGTTVHREVEYGVDFKGWPGLLGFDRDGGIHRFSFNPIAEEKVRIGMRRNYGFKRT